MDPEAAKRAAEAAKKAAETAISFSWKVSNIVEGAQVAENCCNIASFVGGVIKHFSKKDGAGDANPPPVASPPRFLPIQAISIRASPVKVNVTLKTPVVRGRRTLREISPCVIVGAFGGALYARGADDNALPEEVNRNTLCGLMLIAGAVWLGME